MPGMGFVVGRMRSEDREDEIRTDRLDDPKIEIDRLGDLVDRLMEIDLKKEINGSANGSGGVIRAKVELMDRVLYFHGRQGVGDEGEDGDR